MYFCLQIQTLRRMKTDKWTKEETLLALDIYFREPQGVKPADNPEVIRLAKILDTTPEAVCRRQNGFKQWYPVLPFEGDGAKKKDGVDPVIWNHYFAHPETVHQEAKVIDKEICTATLVLNLYYQLILDTMDERVPEVIELAKRTGHTPTEIVAFLHSYAALDPFMKSSVVSKASVPAIHQTVWKRFSDDLDGLVATAEYIQTLFPVKRSNIRKRKKE